jgi:3-hydroxybutyryl-CoA dehydrogenase
MGIDLVFVCGAGLMGHGIAQVFASSGRTVVLYEPDAARADAGIERIAGNLERSVAKGTLTPEARDAILGRIRPSASLSDAADADLVVEAVYEDAALKQRVFADLDAVARPGAILASNTSSISITSLARAVRPDRRPRVLGMHFFSPVPVMPLLEIIPCAETSEATVAEAREIAGSIGKQVIVSKDRPGFIVNRTLMPMLIEAMREHEEGLATREDIDAGARLGLGHPMGPLELADFIGLDVCLGIMTVLHEGFGSERFAPPPVLRRLVDAGHLGRKSGRGFYEYPRDGT